jgi:hypothetical protein
MMPHMTKTFENIGLKYSMGGMTGNTFNCKAPNPNLKNLLNP